MNFTLEQAMEKFPQIKHWQDEYTKANTTSDERLMDMPAWSCKTCEALARTVMMDQTAHDTKTAAQRQWTGLTDEEIDLFINGRGDEDDDDYVEPTGDGFGLTDADLVDLVRRSEAKLRSKNNE